ncbi:PaaI family thioesterase [Microbacterium aurum]
MVDDQNTEQVDSADEDDIESRRRGTEELGRAMRALAEAVVLTEVHPTQLIAAARIADSLTDALTAESRSIRQIPAVDDMGSGVRYFSPVTGVGHPTSPPMERTLREDGSLVAWGTLGANFEGPPSLTHGGMIALIFDELLGWAATAVHAHGLTASLEVSYLRGVPLGKEITITARVVRQEGRKVWAEGDLALTSDQNRILSTAKALFVRPREELRHEYFDELTERSGRPALDSDHWHTPTA